MHNKGTYRERNRVERSFQGGCLLLLALILQKCMAAPSQHQSWSFYLFIWLCPSKFIHLHTYAHASLSGSPLVTPSQNFSDPLLVRVAELQITTLSASFEPTNHSIYDSISLTDAIPTSNRTADDSSTRPQAGVRLPHQPYSKPMLLIIQSSLSSARKNW